MDSIFLFSNAYINGNHPLAAQEKKSFPHQDSNSRILRLVTAAEILPLRQPAIAGDPSVM